MWSGCLTCLKKFCKTFFLVYFHQEKKKATDRPKKKKEQQKQKVFQGNSCCLVPFPNQLFQLFVACIFWFQKTDLFCFFFKFFSFGRSFCTFGPVHEESSTTFRGNRLDIFIAMAPEVLESSEISLKQTLGNYKM